jgi:hypothetical protein
MGRNNLTVFRRSRMIMVRQSSITMADVTDPTALAEMEAQRQRFRRNSDWLQANLPAVYAAHRGKFICVSGEELFVGASADAALAHARTAHPDDDGPLLRYIPLERMERMYAC